MTVYARSGKKGHNVERWQQAINKVRGSIKLKSPLVADGDFGPKTLRATIAIQRVIRVKPDGIVGDGTKRAFTKKWPFIALGFVNPKAPQIKYFEKESVKSTTITKAKAKAKAKAKVKAKAAATAKIQAVVQQTISPPPLPPFRPPLILPPTPAAIIPEKKSSMIPVAVIGIAIAAMSMKG